MTNPATNKAPAKKMTTNDLNRYFSRKPIPGFGIILISQI